VSTARDIVLGVTTLVGSLDALLQTDTVDALVSLAKRMGIQKLVTNAIDVLKGLLDKFVNILGKLKDAFLMATRLPEILEAVASLLDSLDAMVDDALNPAGFIKMIRKAEDVTKAVLAGLPRPEDIDALKDQVSAVKGTLVGYRDKLVPPQLPAGGTP
jgi:hypothetical protein